MVPSMSAKKSNKFVVLPIFLGLVCLLSAGVIAGINSFTEPAINARVAQEIKEGYLKSLDIPSGTETSVVEIENLPVKVTNAGISAKHEVSIDNQLFGVVYDAKISGYGGDITFQVGFKDGNFANFILIGGHSETPSFGGSVLDKVNIRIKGQPATSDVLTLLNAEDNLTAGKTVTSTPLVAALTVAADDYLFPNQVEPIVNIHRVLGIESSTQVNALELSYPLHLAGVSRVSEVKGETATIGLVYEANVNGELGPISFMVGLKGDNFSGFVVTREMEASDGGDLLLAVIDQRLKDNPVTSDVLTLLNGSDDLANTYQATAINIVNALEVIADNFQGVEQTRLDRLENLYAVLDVEAVDVVKKVARNYALDQAGVIAKYRLMTGIKTDGYIYFASISIDGEQVEILIGYKKDTFNGFIVNDNSEDPLVIALNSTLKTQASDVDVASKINEDQTLDANSKEALIDLLVVTTEDYNNRPFEDPYVNHYPLLGIESAEEVVVMELSQTLSDGGVVQKLEMKNAETSLGYVYEVLVNGYNGSTYTFLVGFNDGKFTGFATVGEHGQTGGFGADILSAVDENISGQAADADLSLLIENVPAGATQTRDPLIMALTLVAEDYLAEVN